MKNKPKTKSERFVDAIHEWGRKHKNGCPHCNTNRGEVPYSDFSSCQKLLLRAMIRTAKKI